MRQHVVDGGPEWREADAAGDDDDVPALGLLHGPSRAVGPAHADRIADPQGAQRLGHRADRANGVHQSLATLGEEPADRDRDLAGTERVEHRELARGKGADRIAQRPAGPDELERPRVVGLLSRRGDPKR